MTRALWGVVGCAIVALVIPGCSHLPAAIPAGREVAPPPDPLRPRTPGWRLESVAAGDLSGTHARAERFEFQAYDDVLGKYLTVSGEIWHPRDPGTGRVPLLTLCPILGGVFTNYLECRVVARGAARRGYASLFLYQDEIILDPRLDGVELERQLRSSTRCQIKALDLWLAHEPSLDPDRLGAIGISLGGIRGVLLAAAEPRIRAHVLCLAGGDLAAIMERSAEPLVRRYVRRRTEGGGFPAQILYADLSRHIESDPLHVAPSVDPASVLMINARFDRHVPVSETRRLRESLGVPEIRICPWGHYSAVLAFPWALKQALDFFDRRLERRLVPAGDAR